MLCERLNLVYIPTFGDPFGTSTFTVCYRQELHRTFLSMSLGEVQKNYKVESADYFRDSLRDWVSSQENYDCPSAFTLLIASNGRIVGHKFHIFSKRFFLIYMVLYMRKELLLRGRLVLTAIWPKRTNLVSTLGKKGFYTRGWNYRNLPFTPIDSIFFKFINTWLSCILKTRQKMIIKHDKY